MIGSQDYSRLPSEAQRGGIKTFSPTAYRLDGKRVLDLPLKLTTKAPCGAKETAPTTIAAALYELARSSRDETRTSQELLAQAVRSISKTHDAIWHAKDGEFMVGTAYHTTHGEIVLTGTHFAREVLTTLLDFGSDGVDPFETVWFWYESQSGSVRTDEWVAHTFFVTDGNRIARESVTFVDDRESLIDPGQRGFTPSIFVSENDYDLRDDDPRGLDTLRSDNAWREARLRFWYRRFYQDTRTGQLMVLRPDEPQLHHFPEGRWHPNAAFAVVERRLDQMRVLLWTGVILGALGLITLWWRARDTARETMDLSDAFRTLVILAIVLGPAVLLYVLAPLRSLQRRVQALEHLTQAFRREATSVHEPNDTSSLSLSERVVASLVRRTAPLPLSRVWVFTIDFAETFWTKRLGATANERAYARDHGDRLVSLSLEDWRSHMVVRSVVVPSRDGAQDARNLADDQWVHPERRHPTTERVRHIYPTEFNDSWDFVVLWSCPLGDSTPVVTRLDTSRLELRLENQTFRVCALDGRFGLSLRPDRYEPKPERVFLEVPLDPERLVPFQRPDDEKVEGDLSGTPYQATPWLRCYRGRDVNTGIFWDLWLHDIDQSRHR